MGWWNYGVMDGDTPLDILAMMQRELLGNISYATQQAHDRIMERFYKALKEPTNVRKLMNARDHITDHLCAQEHIFWQVLGAQVMQAGGTIEPFKGELLQALETDEYAERHPLRKKEMEVVVKQVNDYHEGIPAKVKETGLFASMEQMFNK